MTSRLFALPALLLAWGLSLGIWWHLGRPVPLPDLPTPKLECVSYSPYDGDQNPLIHIFTVPEERLRASLSSLKQYTDCIRLYSAVGVYPDVVRVAAELDLKVMLGIWIGANDALNQREIEEALTLAHAHPDTVKMLIVGNEVLLRREMSGERLAGIIRSVKERTSLPVAYADIPHFWQKYPVVAEATDVVGIHLLPYWDDPTPFSIDEVQDHLRRLAGTIHKQFPDKPLLIAEVGWPSAGRTRGGAVPSLVNEARFVREFATWAPREGLSYNLIEGWDQPWKREPEGTVGGYWGMIDRNLQPKFPLQGPVSEWPRWRQAALFTGIVGSLVVGAALFARRRIAPSSWLALGVLGALTGAALIGVGEMLDTIPITTFGTIGFAALGVLTAASAVLLATHAIEGPSAWLSEVRPAPFSRLVEWVKAPFYPLGPSIRLGLLHWAVAGSAAVVTLALAFDGRHRDFPTVGYLIPAIAFLVHAWRSRRIPVNGARSEEAWFGAILAIGAPLTIDWHLNVEAILWAVTSIALAVPWLPYSLREAKRLAALARGSRPAAEPTARTAS